MPKGVYKHKSGIYKHSQETRVKIGLGNKGKTIPIHVKKLHSERLKKLIGINAIHWQGGHNKKELQKKWLEKNYGRKLWHNNQRRIKKLGNGGSHSLGEWEILKAQYNWTCPSCKRIEPEITLSRDHIIPLTKGGSDNIENIQPLCRSCNSSKNNKLIPKYNV